MKGIKEQLLEDFENIDENYGSSYGEDRYEHMKLWVQKMLDANTPEDEMGDILNAKFGPYSDVYLDQILRDIQGLNEVEGLNEAYEDRVDQIVNDIIQKHPDGVKIAHLPEIVKGSAFKLKAPEYRMGDKMMKELTVDVKKALAAKGAIKKAAPKATPSRPSDDMLRQLAYAIERYAGESFPDGDPIDFLIPWMQKNGIEPDASILDRATRKFLGAKSYSDYLANLYADFTADNPGMYGLDPEQNPWRESVDEVSPPGFKGTVKAMKKHDDIDNPWALAWWMKNKGYKSHKKADGSDKNESLEEAGLTFPLEDPSRKWDMDNPKILHIKHDPARYEYVGANRDVIDMMYALGHVGGRFSDNQLDTEQRHAYNKGYKFVVVQDEDRDYYMQETLKRIQTLSGIKK